MRIYMIKKQKQIQQGIYLWRKEVTSLILSNHKNRKIAKKGNKDKVKGFKIFKKLFKI